MENLGATHEVARALGVSRQRVHQIITEEADAPQPIVSVANGRTPLFDMTEWRKWAKARGRNWAEDWRQPPAVDEIQRA